MPIKHEAAMRVAQALLGAYVKHGYAHSSEVEDAAALIVQAVEIDELKAQIASLDAKIAVKNLLKDCGS